MRLTLGGEQKLTVCATVFLGVFQLDGVKTLADGSDALVRGENAFSRRRDGVLYSRDNKCLPKEQRDSLTALAMSSAA